MLDFGIDAQTEVVEADLPTGQLIALQIKTGRAVENYFANGAPDPDPPDWYGFAAGAFDE